MAQLRFYSNEKLFPIPGKSTKGFRYAITSYGRLISYQEDPADGRFLSQPKVSGYPAFSIRKNGINKTFLTHRLVAKYFLKQPTPKHKIVIHLNHKKEDNYIQNLKWVTQEERLAHDLRYRRGKEIGNYKLTADRVRMIKRKLLNGKTRLKIIGKQFGVSDMQIHRIKTGENWGHVKI
jgi:hypothetical protein